MRAERTSCTTMRTSEVCAIYSSPLTDALPAHDSARSSVGCCVFVLCMGARACPTKCPRQLYMRASVPPAHAPALQYYSKPQQVHRRVIVRGTAAVAGPETARRRRCDAHADARATRAGLWAAVPQLVSESAMIALYMLTSNTRGSHELRSLV